ncbi:hypothetical protein HOY80DRAFT_1040726 [Tuber brumale]|nr:hypothetical protein HOY80DRAFT_1040726 [Tuber brumale]
MARVLALTGVVEPGLGEESGIPATDERTMHVWRQSAAAVSPEVSILRVYCETLQEVGQILNDHWEVHGQSVILYKKTVGPARPLDPRTELKNDRDRMRPREKPFGRLMHCARSSRNIWGMLNVATRTTFTLRIDHGP